MNIRALSPQILSENLRFFTSLVVMIALTPLFLKYLGGTQFGIWATLSSLVGYFGVLDLGLGGTSPKLFAERFALNDFEEINRCLSTLFTFFLAGGILLILFVLPLSYFLVSFLNFPPNYFLIAKFTLLILCVNFSLSFLASIWYSLLFGAQKLHMANWIGTFSLLLLAGSVYYFLDQGLGLIGVALANLFVNLFGFLLTLFYVRKKFPKIHLHFLRLDPKFLKEALALSLYVLLGNIGVSLIYNTDNIIISKFLSIEYVAAYAIAFRLCYTALNFVFNFSKVFLPTFTQLKTNQDNDQLREVFLNCSQITVRIGALLMLILLFNGERIIQIWTGSSYFVGIATWSALTFLLLTTPAIQTGTTLLLGIGQIKWTTYMTFLEALINILLSILLAKPLGVLGVALGTLLSRLATNAWFVPYYACRHLQLAYKTYLYQIVCPAYLTAIPILGLAYIFREDNRNSLAIPWIVKMLLVAWAYILLYRWFRNNFLKKRPMKIQSESADFNL